MFTHTFSLLDGLSKPTQMVKRCADLGYTSCAITDHSSIGGAPQFVRACKETCIKCGKAKKAHPHSKCQKCEGANIKPILGTEFYICDKEPSVRTDNKHKHHLVVLAKNLAGWKSLVNLTSISNQHFYYKPRLDNKTIAQYANGNLIAFSGHLGSELSNVLYDNAAEDSWLTPTLHADYMNRAVAKAYELEAVFGKGNFFIEIQLIDKEHIPFTVQAADILRAVSIKTGIPCVATPDAHYPSKEDADDQRVLLCTSLALTLPKVKRMVMSGQDVPLGGFFTSRNYNIPSLDEMVVNHTDEELANTKLIESMCENYNILSKPLFPQFDCGDKTGEELLRELCLQGWAKRIKGKIPEERLSEYAERAKKELGVFNGAGLAGYFLIVQDYVNWAKNQGWLTGVGRGSGMGCLVSYLLGITGGDPIPYDLMFERFYNAGRNTPDRVALPDIDSDFPKSKRPKVIEYVRNKYGRDKVSGIVTYGRMQGRSAVKDVLRAHETCGFDEMDKITEYIPDEAEISDQLQVMMEETGEASIVRWALENHPKELSEWAYIDDDGEVQSAQGNYGQLFQQAIRLEGTYRSQGKHASGIIITNTPLAEICPLVYAKTDVTEEPELVCGFDMRDAEEVGLVKFDILGVAVLDKLQGVRDYLRTGRYE
jgi:DNA polymerase-3 subunit alpha